MTNQLDEANDTQEPTPGDSAIAGYHAPNLDAAKAKQRQIKEEQNRVQWFKWNEGKNHVRILPPYAAGADFWHETYLHWMPNSAGKNIPVECAKRYGDMCIICEHVQELYDREEKTEAGILRAKRRAFMNVVDISSQEKIDEGVQVMSIGVQLLNSILELFTDADWSNLLHPTEGNNITITRTGKGLNTKYGLTPKPNKTAIPDLDVLNKLVDLSVIYNNPDRDTQKAALAGELGVKEAGA